MFFLLQTIYNFRKFSNYGTQPKYTARLKAIRATLVCSDFFATHEVIGSSLLFVHDRQSASIWLIDFAKTVVLPPNVHIDHSCAWSVGNHEDGYLIGINNLISIFEEIVAKRLVATARCGDATDEATAATAANVAAGPEMMETPDADAT